MILLMHRSSIRWRLTQIIAALGIAAGVIAGFPASASAVHYLLGSDAVGSGPEIDWVDNTKYDTARSYAQNLWVPLNCVNITPDTLFTIADLYWEDYSANDGYLAYYDLGDSIYMNELGLDASSVTRQKNVAAHEFGHALGLGHSVSGQLMWSNVQSYTSLKGIDSQDSYDYKHLWCGGPLR
ncbi:matrixin family metalloprotease [Streptosporangium sp. NPDC051023]|uniref:matrixin family metalloprotease n=1 Tax=Streptosporangium sp. NPDC051023 TaxID=3155410 RepID=UPI0034502E37